MDVALVSEFANGKQIYCYVSKSRTADGVVVGDVPDTSSSPEVCDLGSPSEDDFCVLAGVNHAEQASVAANVVSFRWLTPA
ncbi:MAG: hypothetical protein M3404_01475 [Actinomycetota bacterium]|nr:hypothetical protein [Actinomycetota bacterium]